MSLVHGLNKQLRTVRLETTVLAMLYLAYAALVLRDQSLVSASGLTLFLLPQLIMLAWFVILVRTVQNDKLIACVPDGDCQPEFSSRLLATKLVTALALCSLPLLLVQLAILTRNGFSPFAFPTLITLARDHLIIISILILPILAIATLTQTMATAVLAAVGLLLSVLCLRLLLLVLGLTNPTREAPLGILEMPEWLNWIPLGIAAGAVLLTVYRYRRSQVAWWIVAVYVLYRSSLPLGWLYFAPIREEPPADELVHIRAILPHQGLLHAVATQGDGQWYALPITIETGSEGRVLSPASIRVALKDPSTGEDMLKRKSIRHLNPGTDAPATPSGAFIVWNGRPYVVFLLPTPAKLPTANGPYQLSIAVHGTLHGGPTRNPSSLFGEQYALTEQLHCEAPNRYTDVLHISCNGLIPDSINAIVALRSGTDTITILLRRRFRTGSFHKVDTGIRFNPIEWTALVESIKGTRHLPWPPSLPNAFTENATIVALSPGTEFVSTITIDNFRIATPGGGEE